MMKKKLVNKDGFTSFKKYINMKKDLKKSSMIDTTLKGSGFYERINRT